jgi:signal peptidase I
MAIINKTEKKIFQELTELGIAFLIAFVVYQALIYFTGTGMPVVSVASTSMLPKLHPGDLVFAQRADNLSIGEIVIYKANCQYLPDKDIIHRIKAFENGKIITKGDNNIYPDPCPVDYSQVQGKVVFGVPLLGWPRLILNYLLGA